jgi:hypothetical protein
MSSTTGLSPRRELVVQRVDAPTVKAYAQGVLRVLLAQDGSTTRLCEAIADGPRMVIAETLRRGSVS